MPYRGGKNGRWERAGQRLEKLKNVKPKTCNFVYQLDGKIICLACGLLKGDDFIHDNRTVGVELDDECYRCGKSIKDANTEEASCEVFVRLMM